MSVSWEESPSFREGEDVKLVKKVKTDGSFTILENVNNDPNGFGSAQAFDKVDVAKGFFNDKDVTESLANTMLTNKAILQQ